MVCIKLDECKELKVTTAAPVYQGENAEDTLMFLLPKTIDPIGDMQAAFVYLTYIRADGVADILWLRNPQEYNAEYYQYNAPYSFKLTRVPGEVCMWLQIYDGCPSNPVVLKSSEVMVYVRTSKNVNHYLDDSNLSILYELHKELSDRDDELSARDDELAEMDKKLAQKDRDLAARIDKKADNIVFNAEDSTLQLTAKGEPIGDRVFVNASDGRQIDDMFISKNGNLWVMYDDGTSENLGRVVGHDGKVYVPHIDDHKILTFTIEEKDSGEVPPETDLNPNDEWSSMQDEEEGESDYIWEPMDKK